ncbi:uncharacterized protein EI97DRAFT_368347 [Westerdykella ornata]|uniref:Zn(2)-C6 fungal-type domain-containing protein n=1 Tax=Westerdykella ornata TaxID=318751 RepID=A0A6A6JW83_WESOR|nr:uncharacterized protein EI97DRAFT_368347 [Westerdykella ornata]KAF2280862.1 hypothetical protein EI97DRAFT_368347 [Westerdykella ornata]
MPNVGRPSKGCQNCRDRKVKCDLKRPSCGQCIRSGKDCHGYRDPLEMMFRDENDAVARRAKTKYQELARTRVKRQQRKRQQHQGESCPSTPSETSETSETIEASPTPSSEDANRLMSVQSPSATPPQQSLVHRVRNVSPARALEPSLEDQGVGFFISNYVQGPSLVPRGHFDFLPELLGQGPSETNPLLRTSVTAAGLAGLAIATKNNAIMKKAREQYVAALRLTNQALQTRETAIQDSTLVSVIMLGMYEGFWFESKGSIRSWSKHNNGACALIALRGKEQLLGKLGHRIFQQFYGVLLLVATQANTRVPREMTEFWEANTQIGDYTVFGKQWTTNMIRQMSRALDLIQDSSDDLAAIVKATVEHDKCLEEIQKVVPNIWQYEKVWLDPDAGTLYGSFYHVYVDPWIAEMWNNFRSIRILLHKRILGHLVKGGQQVPPVFTAGMIAYQTLASRDVIYSAAADTCATVPQVIGQIPYPSLPDKARNDLGSISISSIYDPLDPTFKLRPPGTYLHPSKPTGMHQLIWPLYVTASAEIGFSDHKRWVVGILHYIASQIGARQAIVLAEELRQCVGDYGFGGYTPEKMCAELTAYLAATHISDAAPEYHPNSAEAYRTGLMTVVQD